MFWVIIIMATIAIYQVPELLRQKQWRGLAAFILVWFAAGTYALLAAMRFPLPTVIDALSFVNKMLPFPFLKTGS